MPAIALTLPLAIRKRHYYLLAYGLLASAFLISDAIKFVEMTYRIQLIQIQLDPAMYVLFCIGLLVVVFQPELVAAFNRFSPSKLDKPNTNNLVLISNNAMKTANETVSDSADIDAMEKLEMLDDVTRKFEEKLEAIYSIALIAKKDYLTPAELAIYLGIDEDEVDEFCDYHEIGRIYLSSRKKKWLVPKSQILRALDVD
jgi:hypothetical protein